MIRLRGWLAGSALLLATLGPAAAQQTRQLTPVAAPAPTTPTTPAPPQAPMLRIDAAFHTEVVNRFAQDHNGRIIVTVSDDKTARIWQASDGALLATLRVPIAPGDEGALYAVALSPDGHTLLLGGDTGYAWDKAFAIYMFDLETLKMRGRLPNLPGPINDIAYAPDGRSFAVAMGNGGGVWLVDATNGSLLASDASFHQRVTAVTFDAGGRLYATGFDGDVRLYDPTGRRLAQRTPVRGGQPYSLAVSPDGRTVAVGYADQPRVELLNARDLSPRASLATDPAGKREPAGSGLDAVAWSADGGLMAAGSLRGRDGRTVLRRWGPGGAGRPNDIPALRDTVFKIGPTADGGVIMVGADPALVRLDRNGQVVYRKESPGLDFRDLSDRLFRVSADGFSVRLQAKSMAAPLTVDMAARRVGAETATRALTPIEAPILGRLGAPPPEITNWHNSPAPQIAGHPVQLAPQELTRSYAAAPSGELVVLGTDYQLRVISRDGTQVGQADLPGAAWAVGVSGDGRMVVAAVGDGTIRWFGLDAAGQLAPRIAMFLAADGRQWVAWTNQGFFDYANAGGEGLVGLQINHARNQAPDWFSFAQVYRRFFAPDVVAARLRGDGPADAAGGITDIRETLTQSPPPAIELRALCWTASAGRQCQSLAQSSVTRSLTVVAADAAPSGSADATVPDGAARVSLQYRLRSDGATTSAVDLFVNGHNGGRVIRQVMPSMDAVFEQPVAIEDGMNQIQLRAYDGQQQTYVESRPLQVARSAPAQAKPAKPTLYLLAVGINKYSAKVNSLTYAVPDARAVAAAIRAHRPSDYAAVDETDLFDEAASHAGILKAMADIGAKATPQDTVLIYFSGHGTTLDERYYFITQDVASAAIGDITANAISEAQLVDALAAIKSSNTMLFLDTCHAGAFSLDSTTKLAHETGRYILAASSSVEEALDSFDDKNGVFATAVLRGLAGQAAQGRSVVDNFSLGFYVQPLVEVLAKETAPDHSQRAAFKVDTNNAVPFPIVAVQPRPP